MFSTVKIIRLPDTRWEHTDFIGVGDSLTLGDIVAAMEKEEPGSVIEAKYVR